MRAAAALEGVFATILFLQATPSQAKDSKEKAKEHFEQGVELFNNGDLDAALVEFTAAYKSEPHFAVRYNIGICLWKLHRYGEAHLELSAYLAEGGEGIPEAKKKEVEGIMKDLDKLLGTLAVKCEVAGAKLLVDGKPYASWIVRLDVGEHEVEVSAEGYVSFKSKVGIPGGEVVTVEAKMVKSGTEVPSEGTKGGANPVEIEAGPGEGVGQVGGGAVKKTPQKKVPKAAFGAVLGITGALAVAAAGTGAAVKSKNEEYGKLTYEDTNWKAVRDEGRQLAVTADVLWAATAAVGVTAIVLGFFTDFGKEKVKVTAAPLPGSFAFSVDVVF